MSLSLADLVERLAAHAAPHHQELARAMVAELASITGRNARARFALGAIFALARLRMRELRPLSALPVGGFPMQTPATGHVIRRHAAPFALALVLITGLLLANFIAKRPDVASTGEVLVLAIPFTLAMTVPLAVFLAVLWVFTRYGKEGVLATARRETNGVRRLLTPVVALATLFALLMGVLNTRVLPGANARLATALRGAPTQPNDRTMTVSALRDAARAARAEPGVSSESRAVAFEVEIQKKFAIAAACIVLALVGAAIPLRFPRGGLLTMLAGPALVIPGYYVALIVGESLADRQLVPAFVAMWGANAILLAVVLLLIRRRDTTVPARVA